jgi:sulfite dehydrogenase
MLTARAACLFVVVLAASLSSAAGQRTITLPPETAVYTKSGLPGYQLVERNCIGCHSAHYVSMQPPTSKRAYWDATIKRMKKPFGAQFPDDDIAAMVDYLVKTYGDERPGAPAAE